MPNRPSMLQVRTDKVGADGQFINEWRELSHTESCIAADRFRTLADQPGGLIYGQMQARMNASGNVNDIAMGFQVAYDTATYYRKLITEQRFYDDPMNMGLDTFVPMTMGEGAWSETMLTNLSFSEAGAFSAGVITDGADSAKLETATASMSTVSQKIVYWGKKVTWDIIQVQKALRNNNWDIIYQKQMARKRHYDLGLQEITFLGLQNDTTNISGLLNNPNSTLDTTSIPTFISQMNATQFAAFLAAMLPAYVANTGNNSMPDTFVIPLADYMGMQNLVPGTVGTYPIPTLEYVEQALKRATRNPNFKLIPTAFGNAALNNTLRGLNKNIYMLYQREETSLVMHHPVPYTSTQPGTNDNFTFQDVAYGAFTGVLALRPSFLYQMQF